jgi:uridine kinase
VNREALIDSLANAIIRKQRATRIGIDGRCGSGKTVLADELASRIRSQGREVLRATVDSFHHPEEHRYRQGRHSPRGYFEDAFDTQAVRRFIEGVSAEMLLVFDGVFLFRRELAALWDYRVLVDVDSATAIERAVRRDAGPAGVESQVRSMNEIRYEGAWRIYEALETPAQRANVVLDNRVIGNPGMRTIH